MRDGPRQQQRLVRPRVAGRDDARPSDEGKVRHRRPRRQPDRRPGADQRAAEERLPVTVRLCGALYLGAARMPARDLMPATARRPPARPVNHTNLMPGRATSPQPQPEHPTHNRQPPGTCRTRAMRECLRGLTPELSCEGARLEPGCRGGAVRALVSFNDSLGHG